MLIDEYITFGKDINVVEFSNVMDKIDNAYNESLSFGDNGHHDSSIISDFKAKDNVMDQQMR